MGLGEFSPLHIILILVIALIVVGPGKLPEVGGAIGKSIREFRKAASGQDEAPQPPAAPQAQVPPAPAAVPPAVPAPAPAVPAPAPTEPAPTVPAPAPTVPEPAPAATDEPPVSPEPPAPDSPSAPPSIHPAG